jgi:signal transduction histidine kinase
MSTTVHMTPTPMSQLLTWVDGIDLPIFVVSLLDGDRLEFVHANIALSKVTNTPVGMFPGQSPAELFPTRVAARMEGNYRSCLRSDAPVSYEECILMDGRETWWQTTLSKAAGFDGKVVLGLAVPITERKEREYQAADMISNMADRFEELRLFSTMAAHDARSPLATVASLVDLVRSDFEDMGDGKAELLALVSNTVMEALEQISSTLERARSLRADTDMSQKFDLGRICGDIAAMVDPEMGLEISVPQAIVECDDTIVRMGVRNLMANAARHCRSKISVTMGQSLTNGMLWIDVADDGPGLPTGETMLDLTRRGEARDGVHGFGLAAIAKLLQSRGGTFDVVKDANVSPLSGARFRMTLPGKIVSKGSPQPGTDIMPDSAAVA